MYIFVQSYILFLNYQIKIVKICIDNTEKSVLSVQIPTNTRLKTMSPMCHSDTWDSLFLFIIIVTVCGKHINIYLCFEDLIYKTVLLRYLPTPTSFWQSFKWFRMACTSFGMYAEFLNKLSSLGKSLRFTFCQSCEVVFYSVRKSYTIYHNRNVSDE